jgi:hypothetical protein
MTTRGVTLAALLTALGRPSWWILALAGFLVRGGILLFVVAIVTLPSPLALSNVLGPIVTPLYLGRLEPTTVTLIGVGIVGVVAWIVVGGWFAAATEVALVGEAERAATEEGLAAPPERDAGRLLIGRSAAAHLIALIPMASWSIRATRARSSSGWSGAPRDRSRRSSSRGSWARSSAGWRCAGSSWAASPSSVRS